MGIINNIGNAVVDAATGRNSGTTLQQFLSKFGSSEGKHVDLPNPLATFDVNMKFFPTQQPATEVGPGKRVLNALGTAATGAINNLGNNLTGGLLGSLLNRGSVIKEHDGFQAAGTRSFVEYLAKANLLVGGENWFAQQTTSPLELQLGFYIQGITIPKIKIPDAAKSTTLLGEFPINGTYVIPDNNQMQMDILCTKLPLHERIFYPWMREVTLPYWAYATQPYTTATITVDFNKHTDLKYVFTGCRPTQIDTIQPTQEPTAPITRQVTFIFDFMFIESDLTTIDSIKDKLLDTGRTITNSASKAINL